MRIAVVHRDRCHPVKCGTECILYCPRVRTGDETVIIGEDEAAERACTVKDMATGEQKKIPAELCAATILESVPEYGRGHGSN